LLAALLLCLVPLQQTRAAERSGEEIVKSVCVNCHGSGANGAPKIGDNKAWEPRAKAGLTGLTQHALDGIRKMPAHGGNAGLSDLEIGRAVTYMVNHSGGNWVEPVSVQALNTERGGEEIVRALCANCHETGVNGAPKIGDRADWIPRLRQGFDNVVRSAIHGHGGMPPRGGQANLSDAEVRNAVAYMVSGGAATVANAAPSKASGTTPAKGGANHVSAGGMDIFLGLMTAEELRNSKDPAAAKMHGGVPGGRGHYHVNITLYDSAASTPIEHALVDAQVEQVGISSESKRLEPMSSGGSSYGNYFDMVSNATYQIKVKISKPGAARPVEAKFEYRAR
jgi:cytochrome c5